MAPTTVHEIPSPVPADAALPSRREPWLEHVLWWLVLTVPLALALLVLVQPPA